MQSWGTNSKFNTRDSGRYPSRSGIIGLIGAAYGMERTDDFSRFNSLRITVRIDNPGTIIPDYQSVRRWNRTRSGSYPQGNALAVGNRYYIEDGVFMVFIEGNDDDIVSISKALSSPVYSLFLGRKSCPPTADFIFGMYTGDTNSVMLKIRSQGGSTLTVIRDTQRGETGDLIKDVPENFNLSNRKYSGRQVIEESFIDQEPEPTFDELMNSVSSYNEGDDNNE
jgi:CRISPR system Cascade subunit CasD